MKWMQRSIVALFVAGALSLGLAGPAAAQVVIPDGLVNVIVTLDDVDITILEDVNVAVAALVVANICNIKVGPVAVLGNAVDAGGEDFTCTANTADAPTVTITNN